MSIRSSMDIALSSRPGWAKSNIGASTVRIDPAATSAPASTSGVSSNDRGTGPGPVRATVRLPSVHTTGPSQAGPLSRSAGGTPIEVSKPCGPGANTTLFGSPQQERRTRSNRSHGCPTVGWPSTVKPVTSTASIRPPPPAAETIASTSAATRPTAGAGVVRTATALAAGSVDVESAAQPVIVAAAMVAARITCPRRPMAGLTFAQRVPVPLANWAGIVSESETIPAQIRIPPRWGTPA